MTFDELVISLDRLTRFKLPEISYYRVFSDIISKYLISPKLSKQEIANLNSDYLTSVVEQIWNTSVKKLSGENFKPKQNKLIKFIINQTFKNIDEDTKILINAKLEIGFILRKLDFEKAPVNLKFLISANGISDKKEIYEFSHKNKLLFPVQKLIIVEGITEEILLPVFADKSGYNFYQNGIYVIGAGGKSKSPSLYAEIRDKIKIPIILLFDNDAKDICDVLRKNIEKKDKIILIEKGEFEDILSTNLIKRVLNEEYKPATPLCISELRIHKRMCENIKDFYTNRHLGEFKKAKMSKLIAENIKYETDISKEIKLLISEIINIAR